jgi:hypothetical protein
MKTQIQSRNEEFFKLSAAAVDSVPIPDVREQEFHDSIREILVGVNLINFLENILNLISLKFHVFF